MDGAEATYGVQLSDRMELTHEGYLRCFDAIIARTGVQTYRFSQLPQEEAAELGIVGNPDDLVDLHRDPEDVFDPIFMASLEDKDVTFLHPDKLLTLDTVLQHSVGHMRDVRPGTEPLDDGNMPLLATLVIKSKALIDKILAGLRQLSCGYTYHIAKDGDRILQVEMTGNHTAVLPIGRAGNAEIQDAADVPKEPPVKLEEMSIKDRLKFLLGLGLKQYAANAEPSDLALAASAMDGIERPPAAAAARAATVRRSATPGPRAVARTTVRRSSAAQDERDAAHALVDRVYDANEEASEEEQAELAEAREELMTMLSGESADAADEDDTDDEDGVEDDENEAQDGDAEEDDDAEMADAGEGAGEVIPVGDRAKPAAPGLDGKGKRAKDGKGKAGMDSMDVLRRLRPFVARSRDPKLRAAFDTALTQVRGRVSGRATRGVRAADGAGYGQFARAAATVQDSAGEPAESLAAQMTAAAAKSKELKRAAYK